MGSQAKKGPFGAALSRRGDGAALLKLAAGD